MRNLIFIFTLVLWFAQCLTAQDEPRFYTETSLPAEGTAEVAVGDPIQVSFVLENGKNSGNIELPDWESAGFRVLGSSQSSSVSIMNGKRTVSASHHFSIAPTKSGTLTIPAASVKNGDGMLYTEPVTVQVLPDADGLSPAPPKHSPADPPRAPKKSYKTIRI